MLTGPSVQLDPAVHAFRPDVADIALAGQVVASHYSEPAIRTTDVRTSLRSANGDMLTMLEAGVGFAVLDCGGGLAWGYTTADHRVGYVDEAELG